MQREVSFPSKDLRLAGTFTVPDHGDDFPAVLLIPGSGQIDRDENHKKLRLNVFHDLAESLSACGFASLRYDKRGVGASGGNYWETGFYDNITDAQAAMVFLREQENIDMNRVYLLGHSEGAFAATNIAANSADMSGIILLAGGAQSGEETLKWQALKVVAGMKGFNKWLINVLHLDVARSQRKQLERIKKSDKDYIRVQLIAKLNAKWMREFLAYNPAEDLPAISVPILAITGSKDIQVNPEDLKLMEKLVKSPFEYHILPDVTHLLRKEEGAASISNYRKLVRDPIDARIPEIICNWLSSQSDTKRR
jgi:alpha-beta hydrolase superfamily lysophospholipase